ncbi:radical SAM/SPASM domain-containing protein [Candidatus Fermentibacteria bacterium]|nr:MAG: radical SAM/SPASM domain-containing protein [Candidatus Fermentibacteria bacterium]
MFRNLKEAGRRIAAKGLHHFRTDNHRIHLRTEEDGSGLLTIDASRVIHLNPVAADMTWLILSGAQEKESISAIRKRYSVKKKQAASDLAGFRKILEGILAGGGSEPVSYVNMDVTEPFQRDVSAPYRMDIALTYRCNVSCGHCYNQTREKKELSTGEWKKALTRIRNLGIPHVIFTGGEATLREDLAELIDHSETLGLVTGLLTNGVKLADTDYLKKLMEAGLDHVQITLESSDEAIHNAMTQSDSFSKTVQGIRNCVSAGIHTITNTTITKKNADGMVNTIRFAHELGLNAVASNAVIQSGKALEGDFAIPVEKLETVMLSMEEELDRLGMRFIWYSPTRYCAFNPLEFDLGEKRCTAGEYNLCIEPDGEVLPCQSWYESAGNFLTDNWEDIWNGELLKGARERTWVDDTCGECVHLTLCGGGCPLENKNGEPCRDST